MTDPAATSTDLRSSPAYQALRQAVENVAPEADLTQVDPDESLRQALDLDSMDFLGVVQHVANLTGVSVPERDYLAVDSLTGFVEYLRRHSE